MSDPIGKEHAKQTQTQWTSAVRDPDPHGYFVRYCCSEIEDCVEGRRELDAALQKEMSERARKAKLRHIDVWNAFVALVHALRTEKR